MTLGQFAFVFLIAAPAFFTGYVLLQAIGESFNVKVLGLAAGLVIVVVGACLVMKAKSPHAASSRHSVVR